MELCNHILTYNLLWIESGFCRKGTHKRGLVCFALNCFGMEKGMYDGSKLTVLNCVTVIS